MTDTRRKRASVAALGLAFLGPSVVPDGSLAQADKQAVANSYYGILAVAGTTATLIPDSFTITEGTLSITAESETRVNLTPDSFTITEGTLSITAESETRVSLTPDSFTITEGTLSVTTESGVNLTPDSFTITEGTLSVSQGGAATAIDLVPDSFTITENRLSVISLLGGNYNVTATFPTGSAVTITLYDPGTMLSVNLDNNICPEIGTTGLYIWGDNSLTTSTKRYQEYAWIMTDDVTTETGLLKITNALTLGEFIALS